MTDETQAAPPDLQSLVARAIVATLGLESLQPEDDVFELGADSITLTQLVARLRADLGAELTLAQVMSNPTPRSLAASIAAGRDGVPQGGHRAETPLPFGLSSRQIRVWDAERVEPRQPHQIALSHFAVTGELSSDHFVEAVADSIRRHEILRTVYQLDGDRPVQVVLPEGAYQAPIAVLPTMDRREADAAVAETVARGFDLVEELPLRVLLIPTGSQEWRLAVAAHNIAFDGWSEHLFLGDVARAYAAYSSGKNPQTTPARPYRDYVRWERGWLRSPTHDEILERARGALKGVEDAVWRPVSAALEGPEILEQEFEISEARLKSARAGLARVQAGLATAIGLAFHRAAARISTTKDIAVGTVLDARGGRRYLDTVGSFTRVTPLRPAAASGGVEAELAAFEAALKRATEWALLPFEQLASALGESTASSPIFQACYVMQHAPVESIPLGNAIAHRLAEPPETSAPFDLFLELIPRHRGLVATATSRAQLINGESLRAFSEAFLSEFDRLVDQA